MHKLSTLAAIAGILTALVTTNAHAQFQNYPSRQPASTLATDEDCTELMGFMRGVKQGEIKAFSDGRVALIPVCEDGTMRTRNAYGTLFQDGNAELLRLPIARNSAMIGALKARDYDQHDVVAVRFGANNAVILYVHQRDMN